MVCFPTTGSLKPRNIPRDVSVWFGELGGWTEKSTMMLERTFPLPIDDSFQPPVCQLLIHLHGLFRVCTLYAENFDSNWYSEPAQAYDDFLGHLDDAIDGLRMYDLLVVSRPGPYTQNFLVAAPTHDVTNDEVPLCDRNSDAIDHLHPGSTSTIGHYRSQHPPSTSHGVKGRLNKRMRIPSLRSSKRTKLGKSPSA